jgi:hypothetical protein
VFHAPLLQYLPQTAVLGPCPSAYHQRCRLSKLDLTEWRMRQPALCMAFGGHV